MSFINRTSGLSRNVFFSNVGLKYRAFSEKSLARGMPDLLAPGPDDVQRPNILGFGDHAFRINNVLVRQSVIVMPDHFLLWNARSFDDITIKSLSIFPVLYPTIEVLFIGTGEKYAQALSPEIINHFRGKGIVIEASSTPNAASTFNMLASEGRKVACALLTMLPRTEDYIDDFET